MTKDLILAALPTLTRPDLEQVAAMAQTLLGGRVGNVEPPASPLAAALIQALGEAINAPVPLSNLTGTTTGKTFQKHLPAIGKFLDAHFSNWSTNKLTQAAFLHMLMELLRDDLKERGLTPSLGIMVTNLGRLPEVFDNAYPGYLEAGLGDMVLRHFRKVQMPPQTPVARKKRRRI
jgi:hypothetical protein